MKVTKSGDWTQVTEAGAVYHLIFKLGKNQGYILAPELYKGSAVPKNWVML